MRASEVRAVALVIEWAVAPAPPLPAVAATGAVAAFVSSLERGPRVQRVVVRALLVAVVGRRPRFGRLLAGRLAPLGEALAALAQLAYYGEPTVLEALGRGSWGPAR